MTALPGQRAAILTALRTLPSLHVHDTKPGSLGEGTTWCRWAGSAGGTSTGMPGWWLDRWFIYIVLYGDETVAESWTDQNLDTIIATLDPVGRVEVIEPVELAVESGRPPLAIRITLTRE